MFVFRRAMLALTLIGGVLLLPTGLTAADAESLDGAAFDARLVEIGWEITDVALDRHLAPPARQQMLLRGVTQYYQAARQPLPIGTAGKLSTVVTREQFAAFVREARLSALADVTSSERLLAEYRAGLLDQLSRWVDAKQHRVDQQIRENLYVGIGIALGTQGDWPVLRDVFRGGPARIAGARSRDMIRAIDGTSTEGMELKEVVDRLRGRRGTSVVVTLQQKDEAPRELKMIRDVVPFETLVGRQQNADESWNYHARDDSRIAYLKVNAINGSTVHELRVLAPKLKSLGFQGLVLDLRSTSDGNLRHCVMFADALLDGGTIGGIQQVRGRETFEARPDCIYRDWPLAVLVNTSTVTTANWIAAGLNDNHRALIVGSPSRSRGLYFEWIQLSSGGGIRLATGAMLRGDGRSMLDSRPPFDIARSQSASSLGFLDAARDALGGLSPVLVQPGRIENEKGPDAAAKIRIVPPSEPTASAPGTSYVAPPPPVPHSTTRPKPVAPRVVPTKPAEPAADPRRAHPAGQLQVDVKASNANALEVAVKELEKQLAPQVGRSEASK